MASLFPSEGSTFGQAWQLVHLIATNEWIAHLRQTVDNSDLWGRKP